MSTDRALVLVTNSATESVEAVVVEAPIATDLTPLPPIPRSRHPAWAYLESLDSETSRPTMQQALGLIARLCGYPDLDVCPWHRLRFEHINAIRAKLINGFVLPRDLASTGRRRGRPRKAQTTPPDDMSSGEVVKLSPASARKHMAALRRVMHYAWELGYITQEECARAINVKPIKGTRLTSSAAAGRSLTSGELLALIQVSAADPEPDGARDVAIFSLGYGLGLRRSDLIRMDLEHYNPTTSTLAIRGKGDVETVLPVEGGAKFALEQWIVVRGDAKGPMFYRVRKLGKVVAARMTPNAIYDIVQRRAREARVERFSPHDLRRTFAGDMFDLGIDIATLQHLMRHADPRTTAQYDRRPDRARREAIQRLHIPVVPLASKPKA